jgi:hypothetical protein
MNLDFRSTQAIEGARAYAMAHARGRTCSDCRYAQPFATQPHGAVCERVHTGRATRTITLGLAACDLFVPRQGVDLDMAMPTPRRAVTTAEAKPVGVL